MKKTEDLRLMIEKWRQQALEEQSWARREGRYCVALSQSKDA